MTESASTVAERIMKRLVAGDIDWKTKGNQFEHDISIWIDGKPKAQPRTKAVAIGGHARVYNPSTSNDWKALIMLAVQPHRSESPIDFPVRIDCKWIFLRPGRLLKKSSPENELPHDSKPDRDNLDKTVLDALTQCGFIRDDKLVYCGFLLKVYCEKSSPKQGLLLRIRW